MKTQIFLKMKYYLKGHPRSYKTTFMPKSFKYIRLWTDFDEILYKCYDHEDKNFSSNYI